MRVFVLFISDYEQRSAVGVFDSLDKLQDYSHIVFREESDDFEEYEINPSGEEERRRIDTELREQEERTVARHARRAKGQSLPEDASLNNADDIMAEWAKKWKKP